LIELGFALPPSGDFGRLRSAVDELNASTDPQSRAYGLVYQLDLWRSVDPSLVVAQGEAAAAEAAAIFSDLQDERGLALVAQARFDIEWMQSRSIPAHVAAREMREYVRRSGNPVLLRGAVSRGCVPLMFGPVPVDDALREIERISEIADEGPEVRHWILIARGFVLGLQGRFGEGLALMAEARQLLAELGDRVMHAATAHGWSAIALLAGDAHGAVDDLRRSVRELEELGEHGFRSTSLAWLALALQAADQPDEAERAAFDSEEISAPDDFVNFAMGRSARALVLADRDELRQAEEVARSAVEYVSRTDFPLTTADVLAALARVLRKAGREGEAEEAFAQAVALYEAKGARACLSRLFELAGARSASP
jgi:tetratricopeptide (TPR) repeat protein